MFALSYFTKGAFTAGDVMDMDADERSWYTRRLHKQLEAEAKAQRAAQQKAQRRRPR